METGLIILVASFAIPIVIAIIIVWRVLGGGSKLKKFADELNIRKANALPRNARIIEADAGVQGGEIRRIIFLNLKFLTLLSLTLPKPHGLLIHLPSARRSPAK